MLRGRDVLLLDGAGGVNEWKKDRPGNDLTVFIPKVPPPRPPIEPLFNTPSWVGKALVAAIWIVVAGIAFGLLYLTLWIAFVG